MADNPQNRLAGFGVVGSGAGGIFINHKAAGGLKKNNFLKTATINNKRSKQANKYDKLLYPPPPSSKTATTNQFQNKLHGLDLYGPHQYKSRESQFIQSRSSSNNYDLNDDSAIGMSETQPLIHNDNGSSGTGSSGEYDFHPHLLNNYDSNSDFGSSGDHFDSNYNGGLPPRKFPYLDPEHQQKKKKMLLEKEKRTTNLQTMMHILKGNVGTGILALPNAFMNSGLFVGLGALPILCAFCTHCMHILVRANSILSQRLGTGMLEYQEVAENALRVGPRCFRPYNRIAAFMVNVFLLITQLGFCCVYSLFVAENVSQFLEELTPYRFSPIKFLWCSLPLFILLSFVKNLRHLSLASSMANLLQTLGLMIVMINLIQDLPSPSSVPAAGPLAKFPLFLGTAIYAFEGIGLILPLQKEMQHPESLGGYVGVLNSSMTLVACMNIAIGFFGYLKFGDDVKGSITLNLPAEPLYQSCKMIFATAIFLSYAIQYYVPINIMYPWFREKINIKEGSKKDNAFEYIFRALLVTFTLALAAAVPKLDLFISLVGALSSSGLALIMPPLIDVCVLWEEEHGFWNWTWIYSKNLAIFLLGIAGLTTGTYASIENILIHLNAEDPIHNVNNMTVAVTAAINANNFI